VHTPLLYGTEVTALRYRFPDVAPVNRVCRALKVEATHAYVLSISQSISLVGLRIQLQILYRLSLPGLFRHNSLDPLNIPPSRDADI
jgi:hypothetical protein